MGSGERNNPFRAWQRAEAVTTTRAYDRFGREIREGDLILILGKGDIIWKVERVSPSVHPVAPAGVVELTCYAVFQTGVPGGQMLTDVLKVQDREVLQEQQSQAVEI